jgi:lysophospholipase L1-like esterase
MNSYLSALGANRPDVILVHAGTNDLRTGGTTTDRVNTALNAIGGIIDKARIANPSVKVYIATIDNGVTHSACLSFNAALPGFVNGKATWPSPVYLVNMVGAGFNYPTMTYDNTHMNKIGEGFTSQQWFDALVATGVFVPEPSTMAILLIGSGGLAVLSRRRARR